MILMNKREQIFKAAIVLFNQNGFDKTPTSQIAKEAGVAIGTLFHYFKTKEELINSLYLRCKESLISRMLCGVKDELTYRSKFRRIYQNLLEWGTENTDEFLFFQHFSNSVYIYDMTKEEGKSKFGELMALLREGMEKEIIRKTSEDYLFSLTSAFIMANVNYFIEHKDKIKDEGFIEETFSFMWNSIKS